jgi:hypothetical protein
LIRDWRQKGEGGDLVWGDRCWRGRSSFSQDEHHGGVHGECEIEAMFMEIVDEAFEQPQDDKKGEKTGDR